MKEDYLRFEEEYLSPYAMRSAETKGRLKTIEPCPLRTEYQRDRDRIIHCKSFRRLKHKTQVFLSPGGDHYRTRLTHTLEVTQIARTISRALRLNEDLTEAIALGHDLGHTPFGHAGERVLNKMTGHFLHNEQSLRVVDVLEDGGKGLNLTYEVRDGILNHKSDGKPATLEGKVVSYADRIAYLNHDIDDAMRAGILYEDDIPKEINALLGVKKGQKINSFVLDIVEASVGMPFIAQSPRFAKAMADLREFMFEKVYIKSAAKLEEARATQMLELLYKHYEQNPSLVPESYMRNTKDAKIFITDYIAGMTDNYALKMFREHFVPKAWE
ncbi:MAG: deoxyguanosinetriphosphate triphosphohydrolase [Clostridia bacterium]|nr:deoxyguanosinetriphosphate triphosphohydrolase [Clostridia bacterium]